MLKKPRKTPAGWSGMMMISIYCTQSSVLGIIYLIPDGIRDIFLCGIRDIMLDIEKYEFLVLGIKSLILLGIISLIPKIFSCYYQAFILKLE